VLQNKLILKRKRFLTSPNADIRRAVLNWQTRRDHSKDELFRKCLAKGFTKAEIQAFFADAKQASLFNDSRFAENFIHFRRAKGYGPLRIQAELLARGIPDEMIAEMLDIADNAWFQEVQRIWQKHFKGKQPEDFKAKAKQIRFLHYRGFTQEQIEKIFE